MPWSAVKQKLVAEKRRLAAAFLREAEENQAALAEGKLLASKEYENVRSADQLQFLDSGLQCQLARVYERVTTVNDALVKYQRYRSAGAGQEEYEKKGVEFQQFIAWYRDGLNTALLNLKSRLREEMREPPEPEPMELRP